MNVITLRGRKRARARSRLMSISGATCYVMFIPFFVSLTTITCFQLSHKQCWQQQQQPNFHVGGMCNKHLHMTSTSSSNEHRTGIKQLYTSSSHGTTAPSLLNPKNNYQTIPTGMSPQLRRRQSQRQRRRQKMRPMPILGYNARSILEYYDLRPLEVGWRLNSLGFPLLGMFALLYFR
jgi:hypothetical protein